MERLPSANKENGVFSEQAADSSRLSGKGNAALQYRRYLGRKRLAVALAGAAVLLLLSDIACRVLVPPVVLPIGALTSFLGGPLFLYLLMKRRAFS